MVNIYKHAMSRDPTARKISQWDCERCEPVLRDSLSSNLWFSQAEVVVFKFYREHFGLEILTRFDMITRPDLLDFWRRQSVDVKIKVSATLIRSEPWSRVSSGAKALILSAAMKETFYTRDWQTDGSQFQRLIWRQSLRLATKTCLCLPPPRVQRKKTLQSMMGRPVTVDPGLCRYPRFIGTARIWE